MTRRITTDRRLTLPASPREVWARFDDVSAYRTWWPWLRRFDARGLAPGEVWACEVRPPLPYVVTFTMTIEEAVAEELVVATIVGDIRGTARLTIRPDPRPRPSSGTELRLAADLAPASWLLRAVMLGAGPLARFGHDWVIESGARQFAERAFVPPRPDVVDGPRRAVAAGADARAEVRDAEAGGEAADGAEARGAEVLERRIIRGRMRTF